MKLPTAFHAILHTVVAFFTEERATKPQGIIATSQSTEEQFARLPLIRRDFHFGPDGDIYRREIRGIRSRWGNEIILQRTQRVAGVLEQ